MWTPVVDSPTFPLLAMPGKQASILYLSLDDITGSFLKHTQLDCPDTKV